MTTLTTDTLIPPDPPAALWRRARTLIFVLLPAIALSAWLVLSSRPATLTSKVARDAIPALVTDARNVTWTSTDASLSETEMQILETRDYLMRSYSDGKGPGVDLCIIFSEDNRKGTHPPDVCLEGGGSRILSKHDRTLSVGNTTLTVRELVVMMGEKPLYILYFYKCGDAFTPSFYKQQATILWNGLIHANAAGALIRYSVPMSSPTDITGARTRADELIGATFPFVKAHLNAP